jgi:hypothetical protein
MMMSPIFTAFSAFRDVKQPAKKTKKTEEYNIKNNCTLCKDDYMVCKDSPCFITV